GEGNRLLSTNWFKRKCSRAGDRLNKAAKLIIGILTILVVAAIVAVVIVVNFIKNDTVNEAQTIDEMNQYAYTTPEVTTDLEDGRFVRIEFEIITDGKKSLKEVEKREFQIKNLLIKELSLMSEPDFNAGLSDLESDMKDNLNELMEDGEITDVYTVSKVLQQ